MRNNNYGWLLLVLLASSCLAADTTPTQQKKKLTLQDLLKATSRSSKRSTTVAGVRGLEETGGEVDTKARNYVALERLEKVVISEADLKQFIDEGKLR